MHKVIYFLLLLFLIWPVNGVNAQSSKDKAVYTVSGGDTLTSISERFGVSIDDLIAANGISDPNSISIGTKIIIPGIEGLNGELRTEIVSLGAGFHDICIQNKLQCALMAQVNRIINPDEIFAGTSLILPVLAENSKLITIGTLQPKQSLVELAVAQNMNPWVISEENHNYTQSAFIPGFSIFSSQSGKSSFNPTNYNIEITPLPLVQGSTITIRVKSNKISKISGTLADLNLIFFSVGENEFVALQGIHAMAKTGLTKILVKMEYQSGEFANIDQNLLLKAGGFANDPPLNVDPETIDPSITKPEDDRIISITKLISPIKLWDNSFKYPVDKPVCLKSWFGNRRSYNGSSYSFFHAGVDFGVCSTLNIYAPAPGIVVMADTLSVRGKSTIIDHGRGIYSGYWHQSEIKVKVGEKVKTGQIIGSIGETGRVTGPHLHWEIWVNGIQVDPLEWLEFTYP